MEKKPDSARSFQADLALAKKKKKNAEKGPRDRRRKKKVASLFYKKQIKRVAENSPMRNPSSELPASWERKKGIRGENLQAKKGANLD